MSRPAAAWLLRRTTLIIPLLILLPILWALLPGGLPNTADGSVHFTRISEIVSSWRDGIWVPRWSLNLGFGRGIPVFIYGPPLSYWLAAAIHMLGLPAEAAFKAMLVSALIVGATGAYRLGHLLFGVWGGAVAAAALVYAPTLLYTLFVQGNSPQLLAWSFVPWALWAIIQLYRSDSRMGQFGYALLLALALAGTLLSHNVVGLITAESIALLGLILWDATRRHCGFWITVAGGVLGLLLSAWFWAPAVLETDYISIGAIEGTDYHTEFVPLSELLAWMPRLDAGAINPYIPRSLGLPQVLAGLLGIVLLLVWAVTRRALPHAERDDRRWAARLFWGTAIFMSIYTLFCGYMETNAAAPIWEIMPFAYVFQFPARWSYFAGLGLVWFAAAAVGLLAKHWQPLAASGLILLLMGSALVGLYPDKLPPGTRVLSPYEVVRYEVKSGAVGTTSYGEFNPIWVTDPLVTSPLVEDYMARRPVDRLAGMLPPGSSHRVLDVTVHRQLYQITLPAPATISLNLHYFPGWRAQVNQMPVEVRPQDGTGLLTVALPAGESTLDLTFGPTRLRRAAGVVSSLAWIAIVLAFVVTQLYQARHNRRPAPSLEGVPTRSGQTGAVAPTALFAIGAVVAAVWMLQVVGAGWFQLHSPPDQALVAPVQRRADIGERFRLLGLEPLPTAIHAGDALTVVAYWRALVEMDENYSVLLRLADVGSRQTLIEVEQSNPNDIPTSGWATGLYLRNELKASIPANAPPIQYAISVGFRDHATGELLPTEEGTMVELGRLWVLPAQKPKPPAGPRARFGPTVALLGASINDSRLTLYWRAETPITGDYTIFIHLLDEQGQLLGQMDGTPYTNRYPLWAWQPGQIIEDRRNVAATPIDLAQLHSIAVGVYDPATGERLTAVDAEGKPLPNNAQVITWREK